MATIRKPQRYVPDVPPDLLTTTLAVVVVAGDPFIPPDLPTFQRLGRYDAGIPPNLQISTLYVPPSPFTPPDLPTPQRKNYRLRYVPDIPNNFFSGPSSGPTPPLPIDPGTPTSPWGFPSIPRDPGTDPRLRRFTEALSDMVNSLLRRGFIREVSPGRWSLQLGQWEAIRDPNPADSILIGVKRGDMWFNTMSNTAFICLDNTAGAAVWKQITA